MALADMYTAPSAQMFKTADGAPTRSPLESGTLLQGGSTSVATPPAAPQTGLVTADMYGAGTLQPPMLAPQGAAMADAYGLGGMQPPMMAPQAAAPHPMDHQRALLAFGLGGNGSTVY